MSNPDASLPSSDGTLSLQMAGLPLDAFPFGITVVDGQGRILQANTAAVRLLGLPVDAHWKRPIQSPEWQLVRGDGSPLPVEAFPGTRALREQARIEEPELGVRRPDGEMVWLSATAAPLGPDQVLITYGDVSEAHRAKAILSARARLAAVALEASLEQLLRATLDEAEALTGSCIGFYHFMEEDQTNLRLQAWSTRTEAEFCKAEGKGSHYPIAQAGVWADCVRERRPLIHNNYASLPNKKGLPPGHATVLRELAVPVLRGARVVAILGVGNKVTDYLDADVDSVQRLADLAWDLVDAKRREEPYRRLFTDSIAMMLLISPEDGQIIDANPAAVAFYGHPKERLLAMRISDINTLPSAELEGAIGSIGERQGSHFEFRHRLADGSVRDVEVSSSRIRVGQRVLLHSILHDISERKRAEAALSRSQAELQAIYAHAPVMMCVIDEERRILYVNPAMTEFTETSEEHLQGGRACGIFGCIHALDDPGGCGFGIDCQTCALKLALLDTLRNGRGHHNVEYRTTLVNGERMREVTLLGSTALFWSAGHKFLLLCLHDITDRRMMEEALRVSEERYRTQFDRASEGIFSISQTGELIEVNEAFARMHGYTREEMLTLNLRDLDTPESLAQSPERMLRLLAGEALTFEVEHLHKDGHRFPMEVSASLVSSSGTPFVLCFHRDITGRKQADAERRRLQLQLQQAQEMESLGSLAGGVAHDMNNVLGAILGLASANLETQREGSSTYRALDTISKAAVRGGKMVQSLLRFARQSRMEELELDLNTLLREEVRLLERTTLSQVRLAMELAPDLLPIRGDSSALTHAIMNLCVNAVDAMPDTGTLTLRTRNIDDKWAEILVEDSGIGMPKEILDKAMEPFFTTKGVGKGTGLGLAIVYSTVKAHQGQLDIWSEPGRGTRVTMRFPACEAAAHHAIPATTGKPTPTAGALSVLVVDDDELIQSSTQSILEVLGHGSVAATSGEEALLMLEAGLEPDLIILDLNMPGLGGTGSLPLLRSLRPKVPVLLATGRADQTAQSLVAAHPGVTLVPKPFGVKELQTILGGLGQR